jgi:aryl-alcohol dehydrogenase-like predicted oxidoreductase
MSELALGTAQFGMQYGISNTSGRVSFEEAKTIIALAKKNRINTIDTAISYGDSEIQLGNVGVKDFKVITKLPPIPQDILDLKLWVFNQVEASIQRLNVSNLYGLLLHRSLNYRNAELRACLYNLKELGKVKKIGVSIYDPDELYSIPVDRELDIVQCPLNVIDRRIVASGWLERLQEYGTEVHVRSAFLQGLLVMNLDSIPKHFYKWSSLLNTWHSWLNLHNLNAAHACLRFALSFEGVQRVVVGIESACQLNQLIDFTGAPIITQFPDISSFDLDLINPSRWPEK